jgi:DNA-directed RNA polymerase omega subunit
MPETEKPAGGWLSNEIGDGNWPGIDSRFRLVLVAAQRSKQLQRGARPRILADPKRRRPTSIALEEVRQGLVPFINNTKDETPGNGESRAPAQGATVADA